MSKFRVGTLRWAIGTFCALIGAMMLVVPHQFAVPSYAVLQPYLTWWGSIFLVAGVTLLATTALASRPAMRLAHFGVGGALFLLAGSFALVGGWTGIAVYTVLGTGTILAAFLPPSGEQGPWRGSRDLFAILISISLLLNGLFILVSPRHFAGPLFVTAQPFLPLLSGALLVGGFLLLAVHLHPAPRYRFVWLGHLLAAVAFFGLLVTVALPNTAWTAIIYYGGFGLVLLLQPWLAPRIRFDPASLQLRLALALAAISALPLILALTLVSRHEERIAVEQALILQQTLATALSQDVADYVGLHRASVEGLASYPGLLELPPSDQRQILQRYARSYPAIIAFSLYAANGNPIVRSDDAPPRSVAGFAVYEEARRTNRPALDILVSPAIGRPVFRFGVPFQDERGQFSGLLVGSLEAASITTLLARAGTSVSGEIFLVDQSGRLIAQANPERMPLLVDLSEQPSVIAWKAEQRASGSLSYGTPEDRRLAAFARVPRLGWGVVVERPARLALGSVRASRDLTFATLLLVTAGSLVLGLFLARWLVAPLITLAHAVKEVKRGGSSLPLPASRITEVSHLATSFAEMRDALLARTMERERAEEVLRREEETQRFLSEMSKELAASLDYEDTLHKVANLLVPQLAEYCLVDIVEMDRVHRVAMAHRDPTKRAMLSRGERRLSDLIEQQHIMSQVLYHGEPIFMPEITGEQLEAIAARYPDLQAIVSLRPTSAMAVPLIARGGVLGAITLGLTSQERQYTLHDLRLVEELAHRAALAVDNARLYREAQEAIRIRDHFLSIASHDLKTPITSIKGYADLLQRRAARDASLPDQYQRSIQVIQTEASRLNRLIELLLDISRIQRGQLEIEREEVDLVALLRRLAETIRPTLVQHTIEIDVEEGLTLIEGDELRLEQVFQNLISNAIKYSPEGGPVRVQIVPRDRALCVSISDRGIGIPADAIKELFKRFYRADNIEGLGVRGMGLGLYIVHEIIEAHGGRISVSSELGVGSTFTVELPFLHASLASDGSCARE